MHLRYTPAQGDGAGRPSQPRRALAITALVCSLLLITGCAAEPATESNQKTPTSVTPTDLPESQTSEPTRTAREAPQEPELPSFDRAAHSIDSPESIWVITNKLRPLQPTNWAPTDLEMPVGVENTNGQPLRAPAARAIENLVQHATQDGVRLGIVSAYRPYDYQTTLYQNYVARDGQPAADTYSARPGHSEHQTGLAVDVDDFTGCAFSTCFGQTAGGQWVAGHAAEHGFVIRYPDGATPITGFIYEPWHLRYVGSELAKEMQATGSSTLEEFFGLPPAPGYAEE